MSSPVDAHSTRESESWKLLFIGIVAAVIGLTVLAFTIGTGTGGASNVLYDGALRDDFNRSDGSPLVDAGWQISRGSWLVRGGAASVLPETGGPQVALRGAVTFGSVQATVTGRARCGIVARYYEPGTFIFLERIPSFAVWNLVSVDKGVETVLARVTDVSDERATVRIETGQRVVTAVVGKYSVTVTQPAGRSTGFVGLFGRVDEADGCTWDDFRAGNGR